MGLKIYIGAVVGDETIVSLIVLGEASQKFSLIGTVEGTGTSVVANAQLVFPAVQVTLSAKVKIGEMIEWELAKYVGCPFAPPDPWKSGDVVLFESK